MFGFDFTVLATFDHCVEKMFFIRRHVLSNTARSIGDWQGVSMQASKPTS